MLVLALKTIEELEGEENRIRLIGNYIRVIIMILIAHNFIHTLNQAKPVEKISQIYYRMRDFVRRRF